MRAAASRPTATADRPAVAPAADLSPDLETRLADDDHQSVKLWLRLLTCANRVTAEVRRRLRAEFDTTLPRFDLLAQLERAPAGLTMSELSQRLMVTGGNVTGVVGPLESEGLVVRQIDARDRRSYRVRLTPAGRRAFGRMARVHEGWVIELFEGLSADDKTRLYHLLATLKGHLAGALPEEAR